MGAPTEKDTSQDGDDKKANTRELRTYTWEEVQKHNSKNDCWVVIEDKVYEATKFLPYHPGGSILARYAGTDATDVFYAFHGEDENSLGMKALPRYCIGRLDKPLVLPEYLKDFRQLRKEVAQEGLMKPSYAWYTGMFSAYYVGYLIGILIMFLGPPGYLTTLASALWMGSTWGQGGLLQHDLGHSAIFFTTKMNYIFHVLYYSFFMGGSPDWWRGRHTRHHASPNHAELDLDIRTLPLFAWDKKQFHYKSLKSLVRWQCFYWPFLGPPSMLLVYRILNVFWMVQQFNLFETLMVTGHFLFVSSFVWNGSFGQYFVWWFTTLWMGGAYLGWVFAMNHTMHPVYRKNQPRDWLISTMTTTQNVSPSLFMDYFTGHLDYQVEHHLWPRMPRHNYEKVHSRLKALADKHGITFHEQGFFEALVQIFKTLHNATLPETAEEKAEPFNPRHY